MSQPEMSCSTLGLTKKKLANLYEGVTRLFKRNKSWKKKKKKKI